jgi:hypothetical protein
MSDARSGVQRSGVERIADERRRQIDDKGFVTDHDDAHDDEELAMAATCYAAPRAVYEFRDRGWVKEFRDPWPWDDVEDRRRRGKVLDLETAADLDARIRLLEKAGALIAAEIDRLLRKKTP